MKRSGVCSYTLALAGAQASSPPSAVCPPPHLAPCACIGTVGMVVTRLKQRVSRNRYTCLLHVMTSEPKPARHGHL